MIIDMHAHFEPRMLPAAAALTKMDAAGVDKVVLIPAMNEPIPETPEALLAFIRQLLRHRATRPLAERIHRATMTPHGDVKIRGRTIPIYPLPNNDRVAEVMAAHPGRFLGWIFLNPRADPDVLGTFERFAAMPGFVGVKLHPHWHDYHTALLDPILRACEARRMPALIHLGFGRRGDFRAMATRYPKLPIIAAHAGFPFFGDLWHYRRAHPNLYVDLSSPYLDEALARAAVAAMGPERCLYGTDAPYGFPDAHHTYDYGEIRGWIERLPVGTREREGIFGARFEELLDARRGL
ncbi:MAG: amidohydrolase [Myxococcales bacterium]|nr:amidohydrolase [Myxococcales bacterium]